MAMRFTVRWRELISRYAHAVVALRPVRIDNPSRNHRQATLEFILINVIEVEPLAAGICAGELFREQVTGARIRLPCDVSRRITLVKFPEARKIFLSACIVLAMTLCGLRWRRLGSMLGRSRIHQAFKVHV